MNRLYWRKIGLEWAKIQSCYQGSRDRYFRSRHYSCKNSSNPCNLQCSDLFFYITFIYTAVAYVHAQRLTLTLFQLIATNTPTWRCRSVVTIGQWLHIAKMYTKLYLLLWQGQCVVDVCCGYTYGSKTTVKNWTTQTIYRLCVIVKFTLRIITLCLVLRGQKLHGLPGLVWVSFTLTKARNPTHTFYSHYHL